MYSRKKHNIHFTKPQEPKFITLLKEQAGYVAGPDVNTKRESCPQATEEDFEDRADEQPVVVVINSGDLTSEEANAIKKGKEELLLTEKADLSKKIVFKKSTSSSSDANSQDMPARKKVKRHNKPVKAILSFNEEEEEDY